MSAPPAPAVAAAGWPVWTTTARVVVTEPAALPAARRLVDELVDRVDVAASRFRPDSEVSRLAERAAAGPAPVSPLLAELVATALDAAAATDGAVEPALGRELSALGYRTGPGGGAAPAAPRVAVTRRPRWRDLRLDGHLLTLPAGTLLDLGATAKAWTADRCAERIAAELGCGALVALGGDIRVAGPAPEGGWQVLVSDGPGEPESRVRLVGAPALATSSTLHRRWRRGPEQLHHVLDPATGRPADPVWRTVSVAAATCVAANTLATAALVRGQRAVPLLRAAGVCVRLVAADGHVLRLGGWPA